MSEEIIRYFFGSFEEAAMHIGVEYWSAREIYTGLTWLQMTIFLTLSLSAHLSSFVHIIKKKNDKYLERIIYFPIFAPD